MDVAASPVASPDPLGFLVGGGDMGQLIRNFDWSQTQLGSIQSWPQSLRTTVDICLASDLPICVIWGPDKVQIYNDGYRLICGDKHPRSMGQNFPECWIEAWPVIGQAHDSALTGATAFLETQHIFLDRHGYTEECFFTFSFSPIRDESGRLAGLFHPVIEMTAKMLGERRTRTLRDVAARTAKSTTVEEACELAVAVLADYDLDVPFALLYLFDGDGQGAWLAASTGLPVESASRPQRIEFDASTKPTWSLADVLATGKPQVVNGLQELFGQFASGPYPDGPQSALLLPLTPPGSEQAVGVLVAGVSSRLRLNQAYLDFYELLTAAVTTAVATGRGFEAERKRGQFLADLDRAKTAFFSNISHEFRTPLTLMLGPLEDALTDIEEAPNARQKARLQIAQRNALRLQKLVNNLLDFSRIEADRIHARFAPTDMATLTTELASNFRSACEKAGLELLVDCPPLPELVYLDRELWEKIVLNLVSNAFKFTLQGRIEVSLRQHGSSVELIVRDTGTGIPASEMPKLFERFHRVAGAKGRAIEGSGIGLALVLELARLHGGDAHAQSTVGQGSTFCVSIPLGKRHLPADRIGTVHDLPGHADSASAFVDEALRWLPDQSDERAATTAGPVSGRPRILLADDNADMRQYVSRLLSSRYEVIAVADGESALLAARKQAPDMILTDVMMPGLDGLGLLRELRADPLTRELPVMLLSARAGEESRVEGIQSGADDYLVKPFTARELLAHVDAQLQLARIRGEATEALRESEERYRTLFQSVPMAVFVCDRSAVIQTYNRHAVELWGREPVCGAEKHCGSIHLILPDGSILAHEDSPMMEVLRTGISALNVEVSIERPDGSRLPVIANFAAMKDANGESTGVVTSFMDITGRKAAEQAIQRSNARFEALFDAAPVGIFLVDAELHIRQVNPKALPAFGDIEELVGSDFVEVIHRIWPQAFADEIVARFRQTLATGEAYFSPQSTEQRHDSHALEYYEWQLHRILLPAGQFGVVAYFTDVSRHVLAVKALAESDRRKNEFLAMLAHELRNPLAPVRYAVKILQMTKDAGAVVHSAAEVIERQIAQMVRLVDDLLDVSRLSLGKIQLRRERIEMASAVNEAVEAAHAPTHCLHHKLTISLPSQPVYLDADPARFAQVLGNLLSNACKFTDKGGHIQLAAELDGGQAVIRVRDDGIGIASEQLPRIFTMFTQVDSSLERARGGLGIGLTLVRSLVEMHGGSVQVDSAGIGKGSEFTVRWPIAARTLPPPVAPLSDYKPPVVRRVLVVDDNEDAAISLALVLKLSGHETRLAHDGRAAVEAAAAFRPDLVLLDIGLPKLDGYQVAQKIREQPWGQAMVLVALTGWGQEEDRKKSRDAGFNAHFVKPMDPTALTALVAELPAAEGDSPLANRLAGGSGVPSISKARAANDEAPDAS